MQGVSGSLPPSCTTSGAHFCSACCISAECTTCCMSTAECTACCILAVCVHMSILFCCHEMHAFERSLKMYMLHMAKGYLGHSAWIVTGAFFFFSFFFRHHQGLTFKLKISAQSRRVHITRLTGGPCSKQSPAQAALDTCWIGACCNTWPIQSEL